jgi:hypothetical protein
LCEYQVDSGTKLSGLSLPCLLRSDLGREFFDQYKLKAKMFHEQVIFSQRARYLAARDEISARSDLSDDDKAYIFLEGRIEERKPDCANCHQHRE